MHTYAYTGVAILCSLLACTGASSVDRDIKAQANRFCNPKDPESKLLFGAFASVLCDTDLVASIKDLGLNNIITFGSTKELDDVLGGGTKISFGDGPVLPELDLAIEQVYARTMENNPYYRRGQCGAEYIGCNPKIVDSQVIDTSTSEIVSVSGLDSRAFSGLVAHKNGTVELINCNNTGLLTKSVWSLKLQGIKDLLAFSASVADEKTLHYKNNALTATVIIARFVQKDPKDSDKIVSGITFLGFVSNPWTGVIKYASVKPALDKWPIPPSAVTQQVDRTRHVFYYMVRESENDPRLTIHAMNNIEMIANSGLKIVKALSGPGTYGSVSALEKELTYREIAHSRSHRKAGASVTTFSLCGCTLAVGYADGSIVFFCCRSLLPYHRGHIAPVCSCKPAAVPRVMKWCCCNKELYVLYERCSHHKVSRGVPNQEKKDECKGFIRTYQVSVDKLATCEDSHSADSNDSTDGNYVKLLYSIKGCPIKNFALCCAGERNTVLYALLYTRGTWYLRAYVRGEEVATARLEGKVAGNGSIASSNCERTARDLVHVGNYANDVDWNRGDCYRRSCKCCNCGVFVPLVVEKEEKKEFLQPVVCMCLRQCGKNN
jgi:hypothetical protein